MAETRRPHRFGFARWPLRARVALAFLVTTALALLGLGLYVQLRVSATLEERLRDGLQAEMERLAAAAPGERERSVEQMAGETYAQVVTRDGRVRASSAAVDGPLLDREHIEAALAGSGYVEADVVVRDDDDARGTGETEEEPAILLVRTASDQVLVVGASRDDTDEAVAEVRTQLLVSGPVALALAGVLGYVVAGLGLRPIERMRARAATISARSAGERLPLPAADDELSRLAETLNAMLQRLDEGLRRERRFVAEASHELRTPLTLMLTEIELALSRPRPPDQLLDALRSAEEETRRLIALAEDLLQLAAADTVPIEPRALDLTAVAEDVVRRFRAAAPDGRRISVTATESVAVVGDPERLRRVVGNLVDNAVRHGAGDVEVTVEASEAEVVLSVADHGTGFGEPRPFDRFTGSHGSTGLGLAIVAEIVRAHGGSVGVVREEGRTVVRVGLPALDPR